MARAKRSSDYIPKKELHNEWHSRFSNGTIEIQVRCLNEREYRVAQIFADDCAFNLEAYHPERVAYTIRRMGGIPHKTQTPPGVAPCDGCTEAHRCRAMSLACGEFLAFVTISNPGSKARAAWSSPNRTMYATIYDPADKLELF